MKCRGCDKQAKPRTSKMGKQPEWCSERCRKSQYAEPCIKCGKPQAGRASRASQKYCAACAREVSNRKSRERAAPQRAMVERMWREGASSREIGDAIGWKGKTHPAVYMGQLRQRGYDLPIRNSGVSEANRARWAAA